METWRRGWLVDLRALGSRYAEPSEQMLLAHVTYHRPLCLQERPTRDAFGHASFKAFMPVILELGGSALSQDLPGATLGRRQGSGVPERKMLTFLRAGYGLDTAHLLRGAALQGSQVLQGPPLLGLPFEVACFELSPILPSYPGDGIHHRNLLLLLTQRANTRTSSSSSITRQRIFACGN